MRKLITGFTLLSFLISCSDEDNEKCLLVKRNYGAIEYNYQGLVYSIQELDANNNPVVDGWKRIFEYEDERLIRINEFQGETLTRYFLLQYSDNQIVQHEFFDSDSYSDYTVTYTLNSKGRILEILHDDGNGRSYTHFYEYIGKNVSKITSVSDDDDGYNFVEEYEYDKKRNPMATTGFETYFREDIFSYQTQNANNIKKVTRTFLGHTFVSEFTYSYNSAGYAKEVFNKGNSTPIGFYEFECK